MEEPTKFINDAQRSALAQIVVRRFNQRIAVAQETANGIAGQIERALAKPFDVEKVDAEIKRFRGVVDSLEARKHELGEVSTLSGERDIIEQAVWLAATVEEAQRLVARVEAPQPKEAA